MKPIHLLIITALTTAAVVPTAIAAKDNPLEASKTLAAAVSVTPLLGALGVNPIAAPYVPVLYTASAVCKFMPNCK